MKHNLGDPAVRDRAITELKDVLKHWRLACEKLRSAKRKKAYGDVVFATECALQALGADPDAP